MIDKHHIAYKMAQIFDRTGEFDYIDYSNSFCPSCKAGVSNYNFCPVCGTKLDYVGKLRDEDAELFYRAYKAGKNVEKENE